MVNDVVLVGVHPTLFRSIPSPKGDEKLYQSCTRSISPPPPHWGLIGGSEVDWSGFASQINPVQVPGEPRALGPRIPTASTAIFESSQGLRWACRGSRG